MGRRDQDDKKHGVARAALERIPAGIILGVGTGSTVDRLIELLPSLPHPIQAAVSSSEASTRQLRECGIEVVPLADQSSLPLYIDGADEVDEQRRLIKGGGGALTREKIIAEVSQTFLCIVDDTKCVTRLGTFPLPIEVIPMAVRLVQDRIARLGGRCELRDGFTTDNGNVILDAQDLDFENPEALERQLDGIPGVVTHGIFARRRADEVLVGDDGGVRQL
ncbi:MAG: ribose-5-phosphate isomerase RpiA [Acidobacteriota bacterium]|nr:ribose-5-phosphate isomerase RpiA [Acidobacteriota bacterium]